MLIRALIEDQALKNWSVQRGQHRPDYPSGYPAFEQILSDTNMTTSPYLLRHFDFTDEIAVVCPRCAGKAVVKGPGLYKEDTDVLTYCVCIHCGFNQKYNGNRLKLLGGEVDPFFHHPLWYMAPCLGGVIWAYNPEHLSVIEAFIRSIDRSRAGLPNKNNSIASRLPKWMAAAKNREIVLKCIRKLNVDFR